VTRSEVFHLARAVCWVAATPVILLTSLKDAVWLVILLSLYANFIGDIDAFEAARTKRHVGEA
jgi:hypothetical protein